MTRKKELINHIKEYLDSGMWQFRSCYLDKEDLEMIIKALDQEPKTVIYSGDGYADGYMVYDMAECPNCGYEYEEGCKDWGENFCPHCGQPLKWEKESDK